MRALCALTVLHPGEEGQKLLIKCLDALYSAYWVENRKTHEKEVLAELLSNILGTEEAGKGEFGLTLSVWYRTGCGLMSETVLSMVGKEGKEILAKNTDLALADGAFGLPWFVATNVKGETETFWGVVRIYDL
jgi:2-hydroxychromene-2-carboxylate isomerase